LVGGGGMKSTINDMKKYISMYLGRGRALNGNRLASLYAIGEMTKPKQISGLAEYYGYGLSIRSMDNIVLIEHGGAMTGISSDMLFSYENGIGVIVLCNTGGVGVSRIAKAAMRLASGNASELTPKALPRFEWDDEFSEKLCGEFVSGEGARVVFSKDPNGDFKVTMGTTAAEQEFSAYPVNKQMLLANVRGNEMLIKVLPDEANNIWAIFAGLRIIKRNTE
jgi:hypothetical protein